jgi:hypothetical protein
MIRKMKCFVCFAALLCMIATSVPVGAVKPSTNRNWLKNSPKENIFSIDGTDKEFVLLETTDSDTSTFFVFAKDFYGNMPFDTGGSPVFDPTNTKNVGFWLNNGLLSSGFVGENRKTFKLPEGIIEHIDTNHEWEIEAGENTPAHSVVCGVCLPSQEEVLKHKDKIGVEDGIDDADVYTAHGWMLRDVYIGPLSFRYNAPEAGFNGFGDIFSWDTAGKGIAIRPVFYLDRDFFKEVKLDVNNIGANVISMFKKMYSMDDLQNIYTDEELWDIFGYKSGIMITVPGFTDENGEKVEDLDKQDYINIIVDLKSTMVNACNVMLLSVLYGSDNCPISFSRKRFGMNSGENKTVDIGMTLKETYKENGAYIKVYALRCGNPLDALSNAVRIPLDAEKTADSAEDNTYVALP